MSGNDDIFDLDSLSSQFEETSKEKTEDQKKEEYRLKVLSLSEGKWNIVQSMLMDIQADAKLKDGLEDTKTTFQSQYDSLKARIEHDFREKPDILEALLGYLPSYQGCIRWIKVKGWEDEVVARIKSLHLYTPEKRSQVIEAMRRKAVGDQDVQAAKLWLTMSGDYSDKIDLNDSKFDKYKEYVTALNSKDKNDPSKQ